MADQYRNVELQRMFSDLEQALAAHEAKKRVQSAPVAPAASPAAPAPAPAGIPTARFPDVPPGGEQIPMTVTPAARRPMRPDEQALYDNLGTMENQVTAGIRGEGPPAAPVAPAAGVSPAQLDELERQATLGMGTPAALPQIRPVDTTGLDAYARMQRGM